MSYEHLELSELPKNRITHTMYSQYLRCPRQFAYRWIEDLKMAPSSNLILGRSVHSGLETGFKEHLKDGKPPSLKIVEEATAEAIDQEFRDTPPSEVEWGKDDTPAKVKDDSIRLVGAYDPVRVSTMPEHVEQPFEISLDGAGYKITGRIDLTTKAKAIVDFKTSARSPSEDVAVKSEQLRLYDIAQTGRGDPPKSLEIHSLVRKKEPEVRVFKAGPATKEQQDELLQNIQKVSLLIRSGIFPKAPEDGFASPCSWCGFRTICRGH